MSGLIDCSLLQIEIDARLDKDTSVALSAIYLETSRIAESLRGARNVKVEQEQHFQSRGHRTVHLV
jgi:hypothetical protein